MTGMPITWVREVPCHAEPTTPETPAPQRVSTRVARKVDHAFRDPDRRYYQSMGRSMMGDWLPSNTSRETNTWCALQYDIYAV